MASADDLIAMCRVPHGKKIRLKDYDPAWAGDPKLPKEERKRIRRGARSRRTSPPWPRPRTGSTPPTPGRS